MVEKQKENGAAVCEENSEGKFASEDDGGVVKVLQMLSSQTASPERSVWSKSFRGVLIFYFVGYGMWVTASLLSLYGTSWPFWLQLSGVVVMALPSVLFVIAAVASLVRTKKLSNPRGYMIGELIKKRQVQEEMAANLRKHFSTSVLESAKTYLARQMKRTQSRMGYLASGLDKFGIVPAFIALVAIFKKGKVGTPQDDLVNWILLAAAAIYLAAFTVRTVMEEPRDWIETIDEALSEEK